MNTRNGADGITIEVHTRAQTPAEIETEVREGLLRDPHEISPRWFYDDTGSILFEEICTLPEYYQTRTERAILDRISGDLVSRTGARDLVELGSGAATKTRVLLDAMRDAGTLRRYVPFDVNEMIVRRTAEELTRLYPGLEVHGVIGDFTAHMEHIPEGDHRLVIFLGGTIGNFRPPEAIEFLSGVAAEMAPGDHFLLGTDLIKDRGRLVAAYDDERGVTARFNRNALDVLNRTVGSDFDPSRFRHEARFEEGEHRIEMWLRATEPQTVRIPRLDLVLEFETDEGIRTEISTKFDRPQVEALLGAVGLVLEEWYTDPGELFALSLARKV